MNKLRWRIRIWLTILGREGSIGLGLLVITLFLYLLVLLPAQSRLQQLQQDLASLSASTAGASKSAKAASTPEQLAAYYQFFPSQSSAPNWLDKIYKSAQELNLALPQGKYTLHNEQAGSLIRYEITLPVTGSYQQIHHFIASVLSQVPIAALDSVAFERSKIGDAQLAAKVKISLYLGQHT
jgi:Tfp pilus assembly protein PilO